MGLIKRHLAHLSLIQYCSNLSSTCCRVLNSLGPTLIFHISTSVQLHLQGFPIHMNVHHFSLLIIMPRVLNSLSEYSGEAVSWSHLLTLSQDLRLEVTYQLFPFPPCQPFYQLVYLCTSAMWPCFPQLLHLLSLQKH